MHDVDMLSVEGNAGGELARAPPPAEPAFGNAGSYMSKKSDEEPRRLAS